MGLLRGFDVSAYQGNLVPACDFAFVKATEGSVYTSSKFAAQWLSAKTHARVRGAYHFARPEESSGASQADRLIAAAKAVPGEMLCLDLEESRLSQAATNTWARAFGDRLRERAPGVTTVLYLGSGYATSGTGRGLADHFDWWWWPQYPSSKAVSTWPSSFDPWLPSGITTGWAKPHIWQFTSAFNQLYDANVSTLTLDQLAAGGQPTPQEDVEMLSGTIPAGKGAFGPILCSKNAHLYLGWDNTYANPDLGIERQPPAQFRVALHQSGRKGVVPQTVTVGAPLDDEDGWADNIGISLPAGCDRIDLVRLDDGDRPVGFCVI